VLVATLAPIATRALATPVPAPTIAPPTVRASPTAPSATLVVPQVAQAAVLALASMLNIDARQVKVVATEERDFPDGCYGIPREGFSCTQVITPGVVVTLEANGKRYVYHTDPRGAAVRLNPAVSAAVPPPAATPARRTPQQAAIDALAALLKIDKGAITLVSVEEREWPNGCLGIAEPGTMCAQVITPGALVVLEAGGKRYTFHTDARGLTAKLNPAK
jgi:hypothetical protein